MNKNRTPAPTESDARREPATPSSRSEIETFLAQVKALTPTTAPGARGRLIFALDATMSRQPTWNTARRLQGDMFREAANIGGLDIQLIYYRGFAECRASGWISQPEKLAGLMESIDCVGGHTQIEKILNHARKETQGRKVQALVFVGDAMEESVDDLCKAAGDLALLGVPVFMFQEGDDPVAEPAYREIAKLSRGAYCRFAPGAAQELAELLRAVAAYAAGGLKALADASRRTSATQKLLQQLR
jgi:hypothetical protein